MNRKWRLRTGFDTLVIVRRIDLFPEDLISTAQRVSDSDLERWIADPISCQVILEIHESVYGRSLIDSRRARQDQLRRNIKSWLERALQRRELVAMLVPRMDMTQCANGGEGNPAPPASSTLVRTRPKERTAWIEIEFVDANGHPVPHERYRLELPDGSFHDGQLDTHGRARVDGIDSGTCELNFPDRDLHEWQAE